MENYTTRKDPSHFWRQFFSYSHQFEGFPRGAEPFPGESGK